MKKIKNSKTILFWISAAGILAALLLKRKRPTESFSVIVALPIHGATWSASGRIIDFGYQRTETHTHQGVDFPAPIGTPVHAALSGIVTHTVTSTRRGFSGYGKVVVIESAATSVTPQVWHLYAHLDSVSVSEGQRVAADEIIGEVGRTCFTVEEPQKLCGGAHLHFEISPRPYPQDSEAWRYSPKQIFSALSTGQKPSTWITT